MCLPLWIGLWTSSGIGRLKPAKVNRDPVFSGILVLSRKLSCDVSNKRNNIERPSSAHAQFVRTRVYRYMAAKGVHSCRQHFKFVQKCFSFVNFSFVGAVRAIAPFKSHRRQCSVPTFEMVFKIL